MKDVYLRLRQLQIHREMGKEAEMGNHTIEDIAMDIASYAYDFKGKADVESLKGNLALQIRNALAEQKRDDIERANRWAEEQNLSVSVRMDLVKYLSE